MNDWCMARAARVNSKPIRSPVTRRATATGNRTKKSIEKSVLNQAMRQLGPLPRLDADPRTLKQLHSLSERAWFMLKNDDIGANRDLQPAPKGWPLARTGLRELRAAASAGSDAAFFELVAREPDFLCTSAGRVRLHLWILQKELALAFDEESDMGAIPNLLMIGKALARGTRERRHDAREFIATLNEGRAAVRSASETYAESRRRRNPLPANELAKLCGVALATATEIITSSRKSKRERAVEIETGARVGVGRERVRQLNRRLRALQMEGYYPNGEDE